MNDDKMENIIDSLTHMNQDEKEITKKARKLTHHIIKFLVDQDVTFPVGITALDMAKLFLIDLSKK